MEFEYLDFEEIDLANEHNNEKDKHRLSRKMKRIHNKREYRVTRNTCIGATACRYGKRMLHRYNRRHEVTPDTYYKNEYNFGTILWEMS